VKVVVEFDAEELAFDLRLGGGVDRSRRGWLRGFVCLCGGPAEGHDQQGQGG
jgi:hypothetical protein